MNEGEWGSMSETKSCKIFSMIVIVRKKETIQKYNF